MARRRSRSRRNRNKASASKGLTLSTVSLLAYLGFVLILFLAVWSGQQASYSQIKIKQIEASRTISSSVSRELSTIVTSYANVLETIASDPSIVDELVAGDSAGLERRSALLVDQFDGATALRFYQIGEFKLRDDFHPKVTYACIDLLNRIKNGNLQPPIEIHAAEKGHQHIDMIRPIRRVKGGRVIGYVQLTLETKKADQWLAQVVGNTYVELVQTIDGVRTPITSAGRSELVTSDKNYYPVKGTSWHVLVWSEASQVVLPINITVVFIFFLAVSLMGVVVYFLKRSVSNAVRIDLNNILQLAADVMRGTKQHNYQLMMPEFIEAARRVEDLRSISPSERERDDDPNAVSISNADLNQIDPLYMGAAVEVEEIDSSQMPDEFSSANVAAVKPTQNPSVNSPPSSSGAGLTKSSFEAREMSAPAAQEAVTPSALPPAEIFKAYDIRGIVGSTLTVQHAELIGRAVGTEVLARGLKTLAFARDGRLSGPELGQAFVKGVLQTGVDILDVGMVPTPVLYYAACEMTDGSGVMLTGSHNPPQYNGLKMMIGGDTLSGDAIQQLKAMIDSDKFSTGKGKYVNKSIAKQYIDRITGDVKLKKPLSIVIDCGNGVAGAIAPLLFKSMGCRVTELFCKVDGNFPNHHPDPSKPENLQDLIGKVRETGADLGIAFDGDGDRLGVVDSQGNIIYPDRYLILLAQDVLSRNHGAQIIYDIKCSSNLTKAIWEKGGEPLMWKTGHSFIKAKMIQSGALLAGEMSGHIFFKERWYGFDDGLYSGARLLEVLSQLPEKSDAVFAALPDAYNTPELNIEMAEGENHEFIEQLLIQAEFGDGNITMIDGIRADFEDGWGLVRASNTTPVLVLRFEGRDEAAMKRIQQLFKTQILAINPNLKMPF